jgi:hypothetical protein
MDLALAAADHAGFPRREAARARFLRRRGRERHRRAAAPGLEYAEIR